MSAPPQLDTVLQNGLPHPTEVLCIYIGSMFAVDGRITRFRVWKCWEWRLRWHEITPTKHLAFTAQPHRRLGIPQYCVTFRCFGRPLLPYSVRMCISFVGKLASHPLQGLMVYSFGSLQVKHRLLILQAICRPDYYVRLATHTPDCRRRLVGAHEYPSPPGRQKITHRPHTKARPHRTSFRPDT